MHAKLLTKIGLKWRSHRELCSVLHGSLNAEELSLGENGYMYVYGWVPSLSTWNYRNIVN